jgi:polyhydroxybutyrate depolymerase
MPDFILSNSAIACYKGLFQKTLGCVLAVALWGTPVSCLAARNPEQQGKQQETTAFIGQSGLNVKETLIVDGRVRKTIVHLPPGYRQNVERPLVIVLHGAKLTAKIAQLVTEFDKISNENNFIVAYPNALHHQWNDGRGKGYTPSYGIDDVKFISQLIDYLIWKYQVNPKKVYIAGFSSGGMLSQKLGMERADKIAAIAEVSSSLPLSQLALNRKPSKPLPVLMINGTRDPAFPWEGGNTRIVGIKVGPVAPIMDSVQFWLDANGGLTSPPDFHQVLSSKKGGGAVDVTYYPTASNTCVILYKIYGGGHTWPGSEVPLRYIPLLGRQSRDLKASELIWEFFKGY